MAISTFTEQFADLQRPPPQDTVMSLNKNQIATVWNEEHH